jgi:hypothetical protein
LNNIKEDILKAFTSEEQNESRLLALIKLIRTKDITL